MANIRMTLAALSGAVLLSACVMPHPDDGGGSANLTQQDADNSVQQSFGNTVQKKNIGPGQQELSLGVASFENENLVASEKELVRALQLGLSGKHDQILAHKYLAFINCVSHRKKQCRKEFRETLEVDPAFNLSPAEAGHPLWGPVFRAEKARYAKAKFAHNEP